jgi:hypothetical protein
MLTFRPRCLVLTDLHFSKGDFPRARQAAYSGCIAEYHFYTQPNLARLDARYGESDRRDQNMRADYDRAAMSPYPLS